jgi:hypothetical protein
MSDELKITKEKVLEAAKKCASAKQVLSTLFPEVFEKKLYKCGTIFVEGNKPLPTDTETIPLAYLGRFWILAHSAKPKEYHLINMRTGFSDSLAPTSSTWPTFRRESPHGIEIPDEDLGGLKVFSLPLYQNQKELKKE